MNKPTLTSIGSALLGAVKPMPLAKIKTLDDFEKMLARELEQEEADHLEVVEDRQARAREGRDHAAEVSSRRAELASSLSVDLGALAAALAFRRADARPSAGVAFDALATLLRPDPQDVDLRAVDEAAHVLAAEGVLPAIRKGSAFGEVRALRDLPPVRTDAPVATREWDDLVRSLGLSVIKRDFSEGFDLIAARVEDRRRSGGFGKSDERSRELATRALQLELEAARKANHDALNRYRTALASQRGDIIAAIDVALAKTPLGIAWSYLRELRRGANGEAGRRIDALSALAAVRVLGVSIDIAKPAAPSAPNP